MWFRYLTRSAACAVFLALAASAFVRTHLYEVMSALAPTVPETATVNAPTHSDGVDPLAGESASESPAEEKGHSTALPRTKGAKGHSPAAGRSGASRMSVQDAFELDLDRGIRKTGERRYEIARKSLDLALGNLALLARWVRVAPEVRDGKPLGFRLVTITTLGPMAKLGLQKDDVLISINGLDLATPDRVLDAYGKLKAAPHLALGLVRDGAEVIQDYTIR